MGTYGDEYIDRGYITVGIEYSTKKGDLEAGNSNVQTIRLGGNSFAYNNYTYYGTYYEQDKTDPTKYTFIFAKSKAPLYYYRFFTQIRSNGPFILSSYGDKIYGSINTIDYSKAENEDAVDLGEYNNIWASCNLGASNPKEAGFKFAWGKTVASNDSYDESYDYTDNLYNEFEDAATKILGSQWRMPTASDIRGLYSTCKILPCEGDGGYILRSKKNGNMIFMPDLKFWTSSFYYISKRNAYYFYIEDNSSSTPSCSLDVSKYMPCGNCLYIRPIKVE